MKKIALSIFAFSLVYAAQTGEVIPSKITDGVDMRNYKELEKVDNKIKFDNNSSQTQGIYNYKYSPNVEIQERENIFLEGNFDIIKRYKSLYFTENNLTEDANKTLSEIVQKLHNYIDDESREVVVSVIGYTQKVEDNKTEVSLDSGYTNFFQSVGQRDDLDPKEASKSTISYMKIVYDKLLDNNISKDIIYRESRVGKDEIQTEEFSEGREKNNRVEVAIYVKSFVDPDTDKDGVHDSKDYCPETPLGASVDVNGCPLLMKLDLKFDFDKATISDKKSLDDIQKLADFMNKYPPYHANIVGHTDSTGPAKYNQKLSLRRAKAVTKMMEKEGVDANRLSFEGKGESEPLVENINPFNRHTNRRTEVELTLPLKQKEHHKLKLRPRGRRG